MTDINEQFELIACKVCGKRPGLSGRHCHRSLGHKHLLCRDYGKCRIREKTKNQFDYVLSSISDCVFLKACPGSGKTEVVGLKAAYEICQWKCNPGGIAVLTFTNNAADVIRSRVQQFVGTGNLRYPHYVGTIDSWLHGYIANPFSYLVTGYVGDNGNSKIRLVEENSEASFLYSFATKYKYAGRGDIKANQFYIDAENRTVKFSSGTQSTDTLRNNLSLVDWQIVDMAETKERFWQSGFATYRDVEYLCHKLLTDNPEILNRTAARFPLIIIDECQDLSGDQLRILELLRASGSILHFIGDLNQAIYSFKDVDPKKVEAFVNKNGFTQLDLPENFRSYQPIVDLCSLLIKNDDIKGRSYSGRDPVCLCFRYRAGNEPELVKRFIKYLEARKISVNKSAILARGDTTINRLCPGISNQGLSSIMKPAMAIHLAKSKNIESKKEALRCMGSFLSTKFFSGHYDSRHYYCPQTISSALAWRLMLSKILDNCLKHKTLNNLDLTWKEWVSALNTDLPGIVREICKDAYLKDPPRFSSPSGMSAITVCDGLDTVIHPDSQVMRVDTIHKAKGETLDAVMLVSSRNMTGNTGGHWKEWIDLSRNDAEHTRFAFVGSSRPKYLLAWAVTSLTDAEERQLGELGFAIIDD